MNTLFVVELNCTALIARLINLLSLAPTKPNHTIPYYISRRNHLNLSQSEKVPAHWTPMIMETPPPPPTISRPAEDPLKEYAHLPKPANAEKDGPAHTAWSKSHSTPLFGSGRIILMIWNSHGPR